MKITDKTTLAELAVELGKHGAQSIHGSIAPGHVRAYRVVIDYRVIIATSDRWQLVRAVGEGNTLAQAIDDAIARMTHRSAADSVTPGNMIVGVHKPNCICCKCNGHESVDGVCRFCGHRSAP